MHNEADNHMQALHRKAKDLLRMNSDEDEIIEELKKEGIDQGYAQLIIENVKSDIRDRSDASKLTGMGIFFIVGGICINYFSYQIAANANAPFFYLFWGIVVTGLLMLVRAFFLFRR